MNWRFPFEFLIVFFLGSVSPGLGARLPREREREREASSRWKKFNSGKVLFLNISSYRLVMMIHGAAILGPFFFLFFGGQSWLGKWRRCNNNNSSNNNQPSDNILVGINKPNNVNPFPFRARWNMKTVFFSPSFVSLSSNIFIQMKFRQIWNKQQQQKTKQVKRQRLEEEEKNDVDGWDTESFHFGFWFAHGVIITTRSVNSPWTLLKSSGSWSGNQTPLPKIKKNSTYSHFFVKKFPFCFLESLAERIVP